MPLMLGSELHVEVKLQAKLSIIITEYCGNPTLSIPSLPIVLQLLIVYHCIYHASNYIISASERSYL
jgi:hypothetical protein